MPLELYLAFVAATAVLILIPGPAVALIVATALAHGSRGALVSVAGVSTAVVGQLYQRSLVMTHRDGFPRFSARSAWRGDAPASQAMRDAARKPWEAAVPVARAISMGHY